MGRANATWIERLSMLIGDALRTMLPEPAGCAGLLFDCTRPSPSGRRSMTCFVSTVSASTGIAGPQACPKGLRHAYGIAAVSAGVPLPTIAAALGHASITTTAIYTTAAGLEAREFLARMWAQEPNSPGSCA